MAKFENSTRGMFGNLNPRRDPREQLIDSKVRSMLAPGMATATEVLGILALVPEAFASAQRRELERLERSDANGQDGARVAAMHASIARADVLRATSAHGEARLSRLLATLDETAQLFHGFVSDPSLQPLAGYRVEIAAGGSRETLSAATAQDGYFRIELRKRDLKNRSPVDRLGALLGRVAGVKPHIKNAGSKAEAAAAATDRVARIVVKDRSGAVVHEDPAPVSLDEGDIYREYVVGGPHEYDDSVPPRDGGSFGRGRPIPSAKDAAADAEQRARKEAEADIAKPAPAPARPAPTAKPVEKPPTPEVRTAAPPQPAPEPKVPSAPAAAPQEARASTKKKPSATKRRGK